MNKPLMIGLGVAGVAVAGGVGYMFLRKKPAAPTTTSLPAMPPSAPPPRMTAEQEWALDHGGQPMPVPGQPPPQQSAPPPPPPAQWLWVDKAGNTQTAPDITSLRSAMLKEWGSSRVASSVQVMFPGETQWHIASFKIFGLFDKFPSPDPASWTIDPTSWSERVKRGEEPIIPGAPLVKTPLATPGGFANFKAMGRMPSGYGVRRDYADAAGLACNAALERMNGRGGAQMVSGRAGR